MTVLLPIARYHYRFTVLTPIRLPPYAGSMLRGAFGQALRQISCMTHEKNCKTCPLYQTCPYTNLFETPAPEKHDLQKFSQIPNPYIIEPPAWGEKIYHPGETLSFSMVLIGRALEKLALITYAWQRAFAREIGHGQAALQDVLHEQGHQTKSVYNQQKRTIEKHNANLGTEIPVITRCRLNIQTPLRLQDNGHALPPEKLTAQKLLMSLVRRSSLLSELHMNTPPSMNFHEINELSKMVESQHKLKWQDWTRYSSRQQQKMQLGGVTGNWELSNIPPIFSSFLFLGQWLHVGKNATFGLGKYLCEANS